MIRSYADKDLEALFVEGRRLKRLGVDVQERIVAKLQMLHAAGRLDDLSVPPGNRLEALRGDRQGQHSIRVNNQYRICFVWRDGGADKVEIVDYH